jgi:hypothetical protein
MRGLVLTAVSLCAVKHSAFRGGKRRIFVYNILLYNELYDFEPDAPGKTLIPLDSILETGNTIRH